MVKHYDETLKDKLPANNDCSDVVLNKNFKEWTDHIARNLRIRSPTGGSRYEKGHDNKLLALCKEHARDYQSPKSGENTIILTHPFYLHLSHMNKLRNEIVKKEADEYLNTLLGFLKLNRDKSKVGVVALETIHHYAASTSLLLEDKLIDRVIFTLYNAGCPLDTEELIEYKRDDIFFGGGYNKKCFSGSIREMKKKASSENMWGIRELVLESPENYGWTLSPSYFDELTSSKMIKLEEVIGRLNLGA